MANTETIISEQREKAKRWLNRYYFYAQVNERMLSLIAAAEQSMLSTTQQYEESSSHTAQETMSTHLARLDNLCHALNDCSGMYGEFLDEITQAIEHIGEIDSLIGIVLANRYLCWNRQPEFEEIADNMGYSLSYIEKLHAQGLDLIIGLNLCI